MENNHCSLKRNSFCFLLKLNLQLLSFTLLHFQLSRQAGNTRTCSQQSRKSLKTKCVSCLNDRRYRNKFMTRERKRWKFWKKNLTWSNYFLRLILKHWSRTSQSKKISKWSLNSSFIKRNCYKPRRTQVRSSIQSKQVVKFIDRFHRSSGDRNRKKKELRCLRSWRSKWTKRSKQATKWKRRLRKNQWRRQQKYLSRRRTWKSQQRRLSSAKWPFWKPNTFTHSKSSTWSLKIMHKSLRQGFNQLSLPAYATPLPSILSQLAKTKALILKPTESHSYHLPSTTLRSWSIRSCLNSKLALSCNPVSV